MSHWSKLLLPALILVGCSGANKDDEPAASNIDSGSTTVDDTRDTQTKIEAALLDELKCGRPANAGVAIMGMLRQNLIAPTDDGGDGILLFTPVNEMTLLGFQVVRMGGWQSNPDGGAMEPFGRGPGTAPPEYLSVTILASVEDLRGKLKRLGIAEGKYVPDLTQEASYDSDGNFLNPQRLSPGLQISEGDDDLASNPVDGAVTIGCYAQEHDFAKHSAAQFRQ